MYIHIQLYTYIYIYICMIIYILLTEEALLEIIIWNE